MDIIDTLAGIAPGSALDAIRRRKPVTRDNAQASFDALLEPADPAAGNGSPDMDAAERAAVALFVATLHEDAPATAFYRDRVPPTLRPLIEAEAAAAAGTGPYGSFPPGPLSAEDEPGPHYAPADPDAIGTRLAAALAHAHMLVFHPRDAAPAHMRALEAAGWSPTGIVTLSQLVAFLSFQLRASFGLRALAANPAPGRPE